MKKLIIIFLFLSCLTASAQVDQVIDRKINDAVQKVSDTILSNIVWYEELQYKFSRSGNVQLDTLTAAINTAEVYQLTLTGDGSAYRIVFVTNKNGVYSARIVNPANYSGPTGTGFNTTVNPTGVIVSMTGNNTSRTYKYQRKQL